MTAASLATAGLLAYGSPLRAADGDFSGFTSGTLDFGSSTGTGFSSGSVEGIMENMVGNLVSPFLECQIGPPIGIAFSEVPVCDARVRVYNRTQVELQTAIVEQQQLSNQLLMQMNSTIGRPSATTVMLPIYIGKATGMFAGMAGLGDLGSERDNNLQGKGARFRDKNLIDFGGFAGGSFGGLATSAIPEGKWGGIASDLVGGGSLQNGLMKGLGVDENSLLGKALGGAINFAFTGNISATDLLGVAADACGETCNIDIGGSSFNPLKIFDRCGSSLQHINVTNLLYGDGACKLTGIDSSNCQAISKAYTGVEGGRASALNTSASILAQYGLGGDAMLKDGETSFCFLEDKNGIIGQMRNAGGDLNPDNNPFINPDGRDFSIAEGVNFDLGSVSERASSTTTNTNHSFTALTLLNHFTADDTSSMRDPKNLRNLRIMREHQAKMSNLFSTAQGQAALINSPKIFDTLVKGNNSAECQQAFAAINEKLEKAFESGQEAGGTGAGNLDGGCVNLTNMMTQSRSLRGDVQAMIAVSYTELLTSLSQMNLLASGTVADGAQTMQGSSLFVTAPDAVAD